MIRECEEIFYGEGLLGIDLELWELNYIGLMKSLAFQGRLKSLLYIGLLILRNLKYTEESQLLEHRLRKRSIVETSINREFDGHARNIKTEE